MFLTEVPIFILPLPKIRRSQLASYKTHLQQAKISSLRQQHEHSPAPSWSLPRDERERRCRPHVFIPKRAASRAENVRSPSLWGELGRSAEASNPGNRGLVRRAGGSQFTRERRTPGRRNHSRYCAGDCKCWLTAVVSAVTFWETAPATHTRGMQETFFTNRLGLSSKSGQGSVSGSFGISCLILQL